MTSLRTSSSPTDPDIRQALATLQRTVRGSDLRWAEPLAAALVDRHYEGCMALTEVDARRLEAAVHRAPMPPAMATWLGDLRPPSLAREEDEDSRSDRGRRWVTLLPYAVLHRVAEDFPDDLRAVCLAGLRDTANHALGWSTQCEPPMLRAWGVTRRKEEVALTPAARQANAERAQRLRQARDATDPALNGRPGEALEVPRPELRDKFSWWCLQLGFMLKSPFADTLPYLAVIDEIGDRCMAALPRAHAQGRGQDEFMRQRHPNFHDTDRYGTTENDALPRYARALIKRGQYKRAMLVCEQALAHQIQPARPGAFERALASAAKKWATGRNS